MRFVLVVFLALVMSANIALAQNSASDHARLQKERADVAVTIFKRLCFTTLGNQQKIESQMADKTPFVELHDAGKKAKFLGLFKAAEGRVWAANFNQGNFIFVSEPDGKCHVAAQQADDRAVHKYMQSLANDAGKNLPHHNVEYKGFKKDGFDKSYIKVSAKADGLVMMQSIATTKPAEAQKSVAAMISLFPR